MITSNAHTHTCFCDGANTPEEMVQAALAKGFRVLGFSGHGDTPFDHSYAMSAEKTASYLQELKRLQKQYAGQIHIVIGMEADLFSHVDTSPYQYLIGSCHYVKSPSGKYYAVDNTKEELALAITEGFSGDPKAMVSQYYENVAAWLSRGTFQILGHFDLVRKFNAQNCLFDETASWYREIAGETLDACIAANALIEVNTGGMARGYRNTPYPDIWLLQRLQAAGGRVIVSADAHDTASIDYQFAETEQLLAQLGFREIWQLTAHGFEPTPLVAGE